MTATVAADIDALRAFGPRAADGDAGLRRTGADLAVATAALARGCGEFVGPVPDVAGELDGHLNRCRELAEHFDGAAGRLANAAAIGVVTGVRFAPSGRPPTPAGRALDDLLARSAAARLAKAAAERAAARFDERQTATVVSRTTETYGGEVGAGLVELEMTATVVRETWSDGTATILVLDGRRAAAGVGVGASCTAVVNGHAALDVAAYASTGVALGARHGRLHRFASEAEADAWWADNAWAERAKAVDKATANPLTWFAPTGPIIDRVLGGDGRGADALLVSADVEVGAAARRATLLVDEGLAAGVEVAIAEEATVQLDADGSRAVSARVSTALTAAAALPGLGLRAGVRTDALATITVGPDGTAQRLTVSTAETAAAGRPPSVDGGPPVDTFVGDGHVYVTELSLDLTDPDVQRALADAGGAVDGVATALVATLRGAVYDRAVVAAGQVTVTEWAPATTKGLDASCGVGELAEVSGGVTATHAREDAVARHVKAAGRDRFTSEPLTAVTAPAPTGNGGTSW